MNLVIFEDKQCEQFYPLSLSHAVFELLLGCQTVKDRYEHYFKPVKKTLVCRDYLKDSVSEKYNSSVNNFASLKGDTIVVNAAAVPSQEFLEAVNKLKTDTAIYAGDILLTAKLSEKETAKLNISMLLSNSRLDNSIKAVDNSFVKFNYLWDMVNYNCRAIENDLRMFPELFRFSGHERSSAGGNIFINQSANVTETAFLDCAEGPIVIDKDVIVQPRSLIQGPAYIGPGSHILGGIVREGCSLGPVCKIGGELEESIILGYSNKAHEGFIGHAYLGEWVNLGAMTTNSDLKNNYSEIKVRQQGQDVGSGSIKVGSFIGDHTKTGIGTLLNTGIVIGFCCNLYGGSLFLDKEIGSFKWGTPGELVDFKLEKAVELAKKVMTRRKIEMTDAVKALFEYIAQNSKV